MSEQTISGELDVEREKHQAQAKKATAAAAFGTFLEYYDFSVYGYCAARISTEFFPSDNETVSLFPLWQSSALPSSSGPLAASSSAVSATGTGARFRCLPLSFSSVARAQLSAACQPTIRSASWLPSCSSSAAPCKAFRQAAK